MFSRYRFRTDVELLDALSGCLFEAGAMGLEEDQDSLATVAEPELGRALCLAYDEFCQRAAEIVPGFKANPVEMEQVMDDYHESWLAALEPVRLLPRLIFCPTTREFTPAAGEGILWFEPRPAFGAGEHATTRLAVRALARTVEARAADSTPTRAMLDVGTGSGVLALVALWLGVELATGTDTASEALEAASKNADLNDMAARFRVLSGTLPEDSSQFPLVVANIDRATLLELAPALGRVLAEGGQLILTGILDEDVSEVRARYEPLGLHLVEEEMEGDWALLAFVKNASG